jgi:hypothetical protein
VLKEVSSSGVPVTVVWVGRSSLASGAGEPDEEEDALDILGPVQVAAVSSFTRKMGSSSNTLGSYYSY